MPRVMALVNSSVVQAMGYDEKTRVLTIRYREGGETYRYFDVPAEVWTEFEGAPSKGTYLNTAFKSFGFHYERVATRG